MGIKKKWVEKKARVKKKKVKKNGGKKTWEKVGIKIKGGGL